MLIYYGAYSDLGAFDIILLSILYLAGAFILLLMKKTKKQIIVLVSFILALLICEVGMSIPTVGWWAGDGYAVTQQVSFIIAYYLAPLVIGMLTYVFLKLIIKFVKYRREKT